MINTVFSLTKEKKAKAAYVVFRRRSVLIDEARHLVQAIVKPQNVERINWGDLSDHPMMLNNTPDLFGGVRYKEIIAHAPPPDKENRESLPHLCETAELPDTLLVALYFPVSKLPQKQPAWFRALSKHAVMLSADRQNIADTELWASHWLNKAATTGIFAINRRALRGKLGRCQNIALKINIGDDKDKEVLDEKTVKAALNDGGRYDVFDLTDAALDGRGRRALQVLRVLYEADIAEPLILWALADAAQKLLTLKNGGEVRTGRRQLERLQKVARTAPTEKIHKLLSRAAKTDQVIKGLIVGDAKIALLV